MSQISSPLLRPQPHPLAEIFPAGALAALLQHPSGLRPGPGLTHLPFLSWLVEAAAPRLAVVLGEAGPAPALARAMASRGPGRVVGIAASGEEAPGVEQRRGDPLSEGMAEAFAPGTIGLLWVRLPLDGATLDGATLDGAGSAALESLWLPRLAETGILLIEGLGTEPLSAEARALLRGWQARWPAIRFDRGEGLLALLCGRAQPDRLLAMAELQPGMAGHEELRQIFDRLGRFVESEVWSAERPEDPMPPDLLTAMTRALSEAQEAALQQRESAARLKAELARREAGAPERLAETEAALARARSEILALRGRERQLGEALEITRQQAELFARLAAERERAHAEILASTSWRLTGPLRRVVLMTRRRPPPADVRG